MKKFFCLVVLSFFVVCAWAAPSVIKGTVVDAGSSSPLDFVNVALFRPDSNQPVKGAVSDKNGTFVFSGIEAGKYEIRISYVGYNTIKQEVSISGSPVNIGKIQLTENTKVLKQVEVVGQGAQVKFDVDKKIYSIDQSIATAGGSASDALRSIPSVSVDNEGNVALRKDANVEVWINGKPSGLTADNRAQVLQQMPAESIESVEVMTNPSAKFNPEGTAGIINLVLKKNRKAGYYGSLSAGAMFPDGGGVRPTAGGNINYSNSKIDAYVNVGFRSMKFKSNTDNNRYNLNGPDTTSLFRQETTTTRKFGGFMGRAGIDYHLDNKNAIGLSTFTMIGNGEEDNSIHYWLYNKQPNSQTLQKQYSRSNNGSGNRPSVNVNLDFKHDFSKESNIMATFSYSAHKRNSDNHILQLGQTGIAEQDFNQSTTSKNNEWMFKTDYTTKLTENSKFEAGWQSTISNRESISSADSVSRLEMPFYANDFNYHEQIHAAYMTYGNKIGKLNLQAGLRAEYFSRYSTNVEALATTSIPTKSDFEFFPSLFLTYSLPRNNELQLNYTRRINRPRGQQINPFHDYSKSGEVSYGAEDLQPEYASAFELNYIKTWEQHSVSATAYYRSTTNGIEAVQFKNGSVMVNTFMNLSKREKSGMELIAKNNLFRILNLTSTLNLYYSKLHASTYKDLYTNSLIHTLPAQDDFSWTFNMMANFLLSKTLSGQITGEYDSKDLIAQGTREPGYHIDFGLRKTFFDRTLTVGLSGMDIFNLMREKTTKQGDGFYQVQTVYPHRRTIGVTLTYNFGNVKAKQGERKKQQQNNNSDMMDSGMD